MNYLSNLDTIKKMRGGELLAYTRDALNERSADIAVLEEARVAQGRAAAWHSDAAVEHDLFRGAAMAIEILIVIGKEDAARISEAKKQGKEARMNKAVDGAIDAIRSALIHGITARSPKQTQAEGAPDAAV